VRSLLSFVTALTLVTVAHARRPDLRLTLRQQAPVARHPGVDLLAAPTHPTPRRWPSYVEAHSRRVQHDLLFFDHGYTLEEVRRRDALRLYGPTPGSDGAGELGAAVFATAVVAAAHAPPPLRRLFDGRLHVGPAILYGGGVGAGAGGHF
jgi:hypothetical protein